MSGTARSTVSYVSDIIVCILIQWWIRIGTNVINLSIADHLTTSSVKHPAFQQPIFRILEI